MNFYKIIGCLIFIVAICFSACNKGPTCDDGIQNGGERGIDCSGPCPDRCDCFDNIANFGEEGVDCGGLFCKPCTSCEDGEQNGDETGIDCGGSCPACELDCREDYADMATYTVNNSSFVSGSANAFINESDELLILADNADGSGLFQISQAKPGFAIGTYDIKNRSITFMFMQHSDSRSYSSEIDGSAGTFEITEFVNETDCKYFSANFNVVLINFDKVSQITVAGTLEDVEFLSE